MFEGFDHLRNTVILWPIMIRYSTATVARTVGIGKRTLLRWLYDKKIAEPKRLTEGGQVIRLWTERDVERVRRYKEANYMKGRGRKKTTH